MLGGVCIAAIYNCAGGGISVDQWCAIDMNENDIRPYNAASTVGME